MNSSFKKENLKNFQTEKTESQNNSNINEEKNINYMKFNEKMDFINNCLNKIKLLNKDENNGYNYLTNQCSIQEKKIEDLKKEINELNEKINEINIAKNDIDKKILLKKVFISSNKISEKENNEIIEEEIKNINSEIKQLSEEIKVFADFSLDINYEIEEIKKNIDNLIKENSLLEKNISKFEKEEKFFTLENIRINEQIKSQEFTSQQYLKEIENKTNLYILNHQNQNKD